MIKTIIFDLDNTLVDFLARKENAINAAITAFLDAGLPTTFEAAKRDIYKIYESWNMEDPKVFQKYLAKYGKEDDGKLLAKGLCAYRRAKAGRTYAFPLVHRTLLSLMKKGFVMGVLSDGPKHKVWMRLVEAGIEDFFDFVVTIEDTKATKVTDIPFNIVKKHLTVKPNEVLFVGELPDRDIAGGKRAGFKTVFASYGYYDGMFLKKLSKKKLDEIVNTYKPDYVLYKFDDILNVIKKENESKKKNR